MTSTGSTGSSGYLTSSDDAQRAEDRQLGELAVKRGFVSREALIACQAEQRILAVEGQAPHLLQLLLRQKLITLKEMSDLLVEAQPRAPGECPWCGGKDDSTLHGTCSHCGDVLPSGTACTSHAEGVMLGQYKLEQEVGRGGMGVVYRARCQRLDRTVALKVIREDRDNPTLLKRFQREAVAMGKLDHPNIVTVFDGGIARDPVTGRDVHFLVMDYIEGQSLADAIEETPWLDGVRILEQVAIGVGHAHGRGVIHRDLKPSNILITPDKRAIVTDFGLARLAEGGSMLTLPGHVVGTPKYMAPEQVMGMSNRIGAPTDVWALGVIMYQLLTHERPFDSRRPLRLHQQISREAPIPPREHVPELPEDLEFICQRALKKDPRRRYPDGTAFAEALRDWRQGKPVERPPSSPRTRPTRPRRPTASRSWNPKTAAVIAALLLLTGLGALLHEWGETGDPKVELPPPSTPEKIQPAKTDKRTGMQRTTQAIGEARAALYDPRADIGKLMAELEPAVLDLEKAASAIERSPTTARMWSTVGQGWLLLGALDRAEHALTNAVTIEPTNRAARIDLCKLYQQRAARLLVAYGLSGAFQLRAAALIKRARTHLSLAAPDSREIRLQDRITAAFELLCEGRHDELRTVCEENKIVFAGDRGSEAFWVLMTFVERPETNRLKATDEALRRCPHDTIGLLVRANSHERLGTTKHALADATRALLVCKRLALAHCVRARIQLAAGQPNQALTTCEEAIRVEPRFSVAYALRGHARLAKGEMDAALSDFDRSLKANALDVSAHVGRGRVLIHRKQYEHATTALSKALAIRPNYADALALLGVAQYRKADHRTALTTFNKLISLKPHEARNYTWRAAIYVALNRPGEAINDYAMATALAPKAWNAWYGLGLSHARRNEKASAIAALKKALLYAPQTRRAEIKTELDKLSGK